MPLEIMKLSDQQEELLQTIKVATETHKTDQLIYKSEWLGYLPFGQYHWLEVGGKEVKVENANSLKSDLSVLDTFSLIKMLSVKTKVFEKEDVHIYYEFNRHAAKIFMDCLAVDAGEKMKVIYEVPGAAFFYQKNDEYYGQVLVSRSFATWTISFKLNGEEIEQYCKKGSDYLHFLDKKVAFSIDYYSTRDIHNLIAKEMRIAHEEWCANKQL
ncbi:hypothetical protein [Marinagarivorans cellulosilyticus]|uniref:Uncharacterized protein n=1 Tax=Marinagarivorans cellulosilyticus TaxID=2721545 RepID=A0AAN1WGZ1_9GAMM|nr:hypothetical protein [Marinagarivorans cellulosilyticus]BCD97431.1 hypothetical protein MARGE09_P1632 [Marinagarivorans cellulosilyticus]